MSAYIWYRTQPSPIMQNYPLLSYNGTSHIVTVKCIQYEVVNINVTVKQVLILQTNKCSHENTHTRARIMLLYRLNNCDSLLQLYAPIIYILYTRSSSYPQNKLISIKIQFNCNEILELILFLSERFDSYSEIELWLVLYLFLLGW